MFKQVAKKTKLFANFLHNYLDDPKKLFSDLYLNF